MSKLSKVTKFLDRLDAADLHYTLSSVREGALTVGITTGDEHWQVEFLDDGDVEVELFRSEGEVQGFAAANALFEKE